MTKPCGYILTFYLFAILLTIVSCHIIAKEEYLGNNLYLSEYDCVDRRILYQSKNQAVTGLEIVPMTVTEIGYDKKWIIAKTYYSKQNRANYWVIKNSYNRIPEAEEIKENTFGPLNKVDFEKHMIDNNIRLILKQIKC